LTLILGALVLLEENCIFLVHLVPHIAFSVSKDR
jgi:hypothetical protein